MAGLDIDYYLSVGSRRYYKGYFEQEELSRVRRGIVRFLGDDAAFDRCVAEIGAVMHRMRRVGDAFAGRGPAERFQLYCDLLCEYIAYYNSVITDAFYADVFALVDAELPEESRFAVKGIRDALFATDNIDLLTHAQSVDLLAMSRRYVDGQDVAHDVAAFVERYRSTTVSSGSPDGISADEVRDHLGRQTPSSVRSENAFLENLHFRYRHAREWSEGTSALLGLRHETEVLVRRAAELSYLKIKMREEFQEFKVTVRRTFLRDLVADIGKGEFDHMRIDEIADFIRDGSRVDPAELGRRRETTVFVLDGEEIAFLDAVPDGVEIRGGPGASWQQLSGDVLVGTGTRTYRVRRVEQDEAGLTGFDRFVDEVGSAEDVAVVTNVLRPHLVPKLKRFGALITQYGGYTSHASVLCRELGINSMISVEGLLDALDTDDHIDVDFDLGTIVRSQGGTGPAPTPIPRFVGLDEERHAGPEDVGAKAARLMRINRTATVANGFVATSRALKDIDDPEVREALRARVASLDCARLVIRSSHESEDGAGGSYAGLFESYVDVDAQDWKTVLELVKAVHSSPRAAQVREYGSPEGDMSVLVQEQISADVSGVVLSSCTFDGLDYLLVEYVAGDLWFLMQGDVTPFSSYISKADVLKDGAVVRAYPAIVSEPLRAAFRNLARTATALERLFSGRVQIEWGMRDGELYIFQVRPY
ncbi:PEP/pyruvate-binding domain-containing protein [Streptomyces sp. NPDC021020]|uniref:PEP/pyruvate-binding domain-containing protein n=1 Tax=Streptomyces sp. NPDC021020 TaxID=3365109 RepID=UPI00379CC6C3